MLTKRKKDFLFSFGMWIFAMAWSIFLMIECMHKKYYLGALVGSMLLFFGLSVFLDAFKIYFFEGVSEVSGKEKHQEEPEAKKEEKEKSSVA